MNRKRSVYTDLFLCYFIARKINMEILPCNFLWIGVSCCSVNKVSPA
nr:MAG TPA: hypothetical protein [Caudoviricetes sp.]